jgi:hypothetical protein
MKSKQIGKNTSNAEVTNVSMLGVWVLVLDREYFLPFTHFPWFKDAKVAAIFNVELLNANHLFWPDLDIDLELNSLKDIKSYPLVFK